MFLVNQKLKRLSTSGTNPNQSCFLSAKLNHQQGDFNGIEQKCINQVGKVQKENAAWDVGVMLLDTPLAGVYKAANPVAPIIFLGTDTLYTQAQK